MLLQEKVMKFTLLIFSELTLKWDVIKSYFLFNSDKQHTFEHSLLPKLMRKQFG